MKEIDGEIERKKRKGAQSACTCVIPVCLVVVENVPECKSRPTALFPRHSLCPVQRCVLFFFLVSFFFSSDATFASVLKLCARLVIEGNRKHKKSKRRQECQLRVSAPSAHKAPKINTSLPLFIFKHILCTRCEESTARRRYLVTYPKTASTRQTNLGLLFS